MGIFLDARAQFLVRLQQFSTNTTDSPTAEYRRRVANGQLQSDEFQVKCDQII